MTDEVRSLCSSRKVTKPLIYLQTPRPRRRFQKTEHTTELIPPPAELGLYPKHSRPLRTPGFISLHPSSIANSEPCSTMTMATDKKCAATAPQGSHGCCIILFTAIKNRISQLSIFDSTQFSNLFLSECMERVGMGGYLKGSTWISCGPCGSV
jgi:hypothetical protein